MVWRIIWCLRLGSVSCIDWSKVAGVISRHPTKEEATPFFTLKSNLNYKVDLLQKHFSVSVCWENHHLVIARNYIRVQAEVSNIISNYVPLHTEPPNLISDYMQPQAYHKSQI